MTSYGITPLYFQLFYSFFSKKIKKFFKLLVFFEKNNYTLYSEEENHMTLIQIVMLVIAVLVYIVGVFYLTYRFGDEAPIWFQFIAFPIDVIGFILLFPLAIYQKFKLNEEYKASIKQMTKHQ